MPDLAIQVQVVKGLPGTAVVILNGSIDAKTVIIFQTHLNSVKERGINRFILDMESVKYVNSTGLGYLINLSDSLGEGHGGISLVKVQPKVKVVFDMLGLNAFFKIYGTRDDALKEFTTEPIAGPSEQTVVLGTPGMAAPAFAPAVRLAPPTVETQHQIECASCKAVLSLREPGTYKCPRCLALFNYSGGGKANFLPRRRSLPVQLSLSFAPEYTEGLLEFIHRIARGVGFTNGAMKQVDEAVRDTVQTIHRHSYGGNDNNIYHVQVMTTDKEIELRFADYGNSLSTDGEGKDLFATTRGAMDRFELRHHPKGGNFIVLSKMKKEG